MDETTRKQLDDLRRAYESGALPEATYRALAAQLSGPPEAASYTAHQTEGGVIQQGQGNIVVKEQSLYVGGSIRGNVYVGPPPPDDSAKLTIYRQMVVRTYGRLPMRGKDLGASDPGGQNPLQLAHVYVHLDTTALAQPDEADVKEMGGRQRENTKPLSVLDAVIRNRRMVLLGDPGSGKSTFVNHVAHALAAQALQPDQGWLEMLPDWPNSESDLLPLVVILRDFARSLPQPLPEKAEVAHLWNFIAGRLQAQKLEFMLEPLEAALQTGRVLLLMDGLDEVSSIPERLFVRDAVQQFSAHYGQNRCLVTCRVLAYQPPRQRQEPELRLPQNDFSVFEIAPFDEKKINRFIAAWYAELAQTGALETEEADALAKRLQGSVRQPDLHRLAVNPLLLTVMALVHTHLGQLPSARARLYEETVDVLLWRWEQIKRGRGQDEPHLQQLLRQAGRQQMDLKRVLWQVAYTVHGQTAAGADGEQTADIPAWNLQAALAALKQDAYGQVDYNWAQQVVAAMQLRAGLLVERLPGVFSFPHRTFQEYLAGAYLAAQANFASAAARRAQEGNTWREVILLAVGRLIHVAGDTDKPLALVAELCPETIADTAEAWQLAWLAGDVLREIDDVWVQQSAFGRDLHRRGRRRLAQLVAGGQLPPRERAEAGRTLARLGDPRPGVGVFTAGAIPLPDLEFCYVPAGPFLMGEDGGKENEQPQHEVDVPYGYWITRYPVTAGQFRAFVRAAGYQTQGRFDRSGQNDPDNCPARFVTWDDARAFGDWLTGLWQAGTAVLPPLPAGYVVTLPSEAEWEKAARGGILLPEGETAVARLGDETADFTVTSTAVKPNPQPARRFPWGDILGRNQTNNKDTQIGTVCVVGAFPAGRSPYGVLDLSGQVWEWTRSLYRPYFYDSGDGREDLDSRDVRSLRGGSYGDSEDGVRCSARSDDAPGHVVDANGFRVVLSPFS